MVCYVIIASYNFQEYEAVCITLLYEPLSIFLDYTKSQESFPKLCRDVT